jgi:putative pyruvate formate lyase activating enzyme
VRHLILPGFIDNSKDVLDWFAGTFKRKEAMLSLMSQYTPIEASCLPSELTGKLTEREYNEVVDYLYMLGIKDGYIQDLESSKESYIPDFDMTGLI